MMQLLQANAFLVDYKKSMILLRKEIEMYKANPFSSIGQVIL